MDLLGLDPDSKLIIAYRVGKRDARTTQAFVNDLADRLANRVPLTTDGLFFYKVAVNPPLVGLEPTTPRS